MSDTKLAVAIERLAKGLDEFAQIMRMSADPDDDEMIATLREFASRASAPSDEPRVTDEMRANARELAETIAEARSNIAQIREKIASRAAPSEGPTPVTTALDAKIGGNMSVADVLECEAKARGAMRSVPLPVPAQEAEALVDGVVAWALACHCIGGTHVPYCQFPQRRADLLARLRSPSEIPEADDDRTVEQWHDDAMKYADRLLDAENQNLPDVARMFALLAFNCELAALRRASELKSSLATRAILLKSLTCLAADAFTPDRASRASRASRSPEENKMAEQKLRQVRPHTVGSHYTCGRCEQSHIVGCDADGLIGSLICPNRPRASRPSDSSRSDTPAAPTVPETSNDTD